MSPRSCQYAVKYHWFREHIIPEKIELVKNETKNQLADILKKGLQTDQSQSPHGLVTCLMFERECENNNMMRMEFDIILVSLFHIYIYCVKTLIY